MENMKIELPNNQPRRILGAESSVDVESTEVIESVGKKEVNESRRTLEPKVKTAPEDIEWRDNDESISARIGSSIIHIDKKTFNIQLRNGFLIKCENLEKAKTKAVSLFNN